jgi:copper chaperone CopZ
VEVNLKISIKVPDMSCEHCKMRIEKSLGALENIQQVKVDLEQKIVEIIGNVKTDEVKEAIIAVGYHPEEIVSAEQ